MKRFELCSHSIRQNAVGFIQQLPVDAKHPLVITIKELTRNLEQNAKFHAMCGDVARQQQWLGKPLSPVQWKTLFISGHAMATGLGANVVAGLEGEYVNIRESSASMSVSRMASLIEYVSAWCVENGVKLSDNRYSDYGRAA